MTNTKKVCFKITRLFRDIIKFVRTFKALTIENNYIEKCNANFKNLTTNRYNRDSFNVLIEEKFYQSLK